MVINAGPVKIKKIGTFYGQMLSELQIFLMCYRYFRKGILQMKKGQVF